MWTIFEAQNRELEFSTWRNIVAHPCWTFVALSVTFWADLQVLNWVWLNLHNCMFSHITPYKLSIVKHWKPPIPHYFQPWKFLVLIFFGFSFISFLCVFGFLGFNSEFGLIGFYSRAIEQLGVLVIYSSTQYPKLSGSLHWGVIS